MFAEIIIPLALPKNYTWSVPQAMLDSIKVGCRVEVNLGKNKKYAGVVKRLHNDRPEFFEAKDILNLLDVEPVVFEEQFPSPGSIARRSTHASTAFARRSAPSC